MPTDRVEPTGAFAPSGALFDPVHAAPPSISQESTPSVQLGVPGPWRRYLARFLDGYVALGLISLIILNAPRLVLLRGIKLAGLLPLLTLAVWILIPFVDALIMAALGTTVGKWLLGIRVVGADGKRLTLMACLRRNFTIWWRGYGCGIPILSVITLVLAYGSAIQHQNRSSWDIEAGNIMLRRRRTILHYLLYSVLLLLLVTISVLARTGASTHPRIASHQIVVPQPGAVISWQNPLNQRIVTIDGNWHRVAQKGLPSHTVELAYAGTQDKAVLFNQKAGVGAAPDRYGPIFVSELTAFRFSEPGHMSEVEGVPVWSVVGGSVEHGRVTGVVVAVFRAANQMVGVIFIRQGEGDASYELRCQRLLEAIVHSYREAPST